MTKQFNYRDESGRFTPKPIAVNRLYSFNGIIVRTKFKLDDGYFWVSHHKKLNGEVHQSQLKLINKKKVNEYLKKA